MVLNIISDRAADTSPVLRHRQGTQRSPTYQQPPHSIPSPESDCSRDTQSSSSSSGGVGGRDFIRELTRERPGDTSRSRLPPSPEMLVDAIFSAHSDGLIVIIRRSETNKFTPVSAPTSGALPTTFTPSRSGVATNNSANSRPSHYRRDRHENIGAGGHTYGRF